METRRSFQASEVRNLIEDDAPSERTVRNTLDAMVSLGFLESEGGTGSAPKVFYPREVGPPQKIPGYRPRQATQSGTFPYPGAKNHLSEWIIEMMPEHDTYVEVFGGSAGILFNKPRSKYEIYNDLDDDLTQFFTTLRDRSDELARWLQSTPYSRTQYQSWVDEFYSGYRPEDPVERAGRFFSLRYMQYLGATNAANGFKARARRSPARTFANAKKRLHTLAGRFEHVIIENQSYRDIFTKYSDTAIDVLFYADPPYRRGSEHYRPQFNREEFVDCLKNLESDWLVSLSEVPTDLEDFNVIERESHHRMKRRANGVCEQLICNFAVKDRPSFI